MSILVKGMEMPTNCCQCPVNMEVCKRGYKYLLEHPELYDKRADDCPLVPVPSHGRLIDAAALWVEINKICDRRDAGIISDLTCLQQLLSAVRHAPIIIEAEEEVKSGET